MNQEKMDYWVLDILLQLQVFCKLERTESFRYFCIKFLHDNIRRVKTDHVCSKGD